MQTAYALHFNEGVPIRKLVMTELNDNKMLVTTVECDFSWLPLEGTKRQYTQLVKKDKFFRREPDLMFHVTFRKKMFEQYSWRFEVYQPFSDTL